MIEVDHDGVKRVDISGMERRRSIVRFREDALSCRNSIFDKNVYFNGTRQNEALRWWLNAVGGGGGVYKLVCERYDVFLQ